MILARIANIMSGLMVATLIAACGIANAETLKRPEGNLMVVAGGASNLVFIATDETARKGDIADVLVLDVFDPGMAVGQQRIVESVVRRRLDCVARTYQDLATSAYDDAGKIVLTMPETPPSPIPAGSGYDFLARVACDGAEPPQKMVATGHVAALKLGRELLAAHR